jgi:hypothetical protein
MLGGPARRREMTRESNTDAPMAGKPYLMSRPAAALLPAALAPSKTITPVNYTRLKTTRYFVSVLCNLLAFGLVQMLAAEGATAVKVAGASQTAEPKAALIPLAQLGAAAGRQYSGDGLAIVPAQDGAILRCAFQRLEGRATSEGLWLTSTAGKANAARFRVVAIAIERGQKGGQASPRAQTPCPLQKEPGLAATFALPGTGNVVVTEQLARFIRPGLTEEYSVSMHGVRQDFVVEYAPLNPSAGELVVKLAVTGARVEPVACGARLVLENSGREIASSRLHVTDATGKKLPAQIEVCLAGDEGTGLNSSGENAKQKAEMSQSLLTSAPTGARLAVVVNDSDAVYPVRIDPTFNDENWISMGVFPGPDGHVRATAVDAMGNL